MTVACRSPAPGTRVTAKVTKVTGAQLGCQDFPLGKVTKITTPAKSCRMVKRVNFAVRPGFVNN